MNAIRRAQRRLTTFDARGSKCPVCGQWFRICPHPINTAKHVLERRVTEQIVAKALKKALIK